MTINRQKQRGATFVTWLIVAGLGILIASAIIKVAPYYVEFNSVKGLMVNIASEQGIKKANRRQVNSKIEKYLNLNNLRSLEDSYYASKKKGSGVKSPFKIVKLKKGKKRRKLSVEYPVKSPWIGNISFLLDFKHSVVLGEPENKTGK
jgi:multidrug efflux pump subunit AcrB